MVLMSFAVRVLVLYPQPESIRATAATAMHALALRRGRNFILVADVEAPHPVTQLVAFHVQKARGLALVPLRFFRRLEDERALDVAHQALEVDAVVRKRRRENGVELAAEGALVGAIGRERQHLAPQQGPGFQ